MNQFLQEIIQASREKMVAENNAKMATRDLYSKLETRFRAIVPVLREILPWRNDEVWNYGELEIRTFPYTAVASGNLSGHVYFGPRRMIEVESTFPVTYLFSDDWIEEEKKKTAATDENVRLTLQRNRDDRYNQYLKLKEEFDGRR